MKKGFVWLLLAALLVTAACGCSENSKRKGGLTPPSVESGELVYSSVVIDRGDVFQNTSANGHFEVIDQVEVFFPYTGGRLVEVNATYFNEVKAGDVLMRLDTDELEYEMEKLEIRYAQNKYAYDKQMRRSNAEARLKAQLSWDSFLLDYEKAQKILDSAVLVAPCDGTILGITPAAVNDDVYARNTLFVIGDPNNLRLTVENEAFALAAYVGMPVTVTILGKPYDAQVVQSPMDQSLRTEKNYQDYKVYIKMLTFPEDADLFGREARATVSTASSLNTVRVPKSCVFTYNSRSFVYVIEDGAKLERTVKVGITDGTYYEVIAGLVEGEEVAKE